MAGQAFVADRLLAGRGVIVKWQRVRKQNHWLDALYNTSAAGHFCGVRLVEEKKKIGPRPTLSDLADVADVGDR